jgi:hypothetical protein
VRAAAKGANLEFQALRFFVRDGADGTLGIHAAEIVVVLVLLFYILIASSAKKTSSSTSKE